MAGFADGFRTGYGVVADSMQARRRAELEERRLADRARSARELAEYRDRTASIQEEGLGVQRERIAEDRRQDRADRREERRERARGVAREARESVAQSEEALRNAEREREARERTRAREEEDLRSSRLSNERSELEIRQTRQREAQEQLAGFLAGTGDPQGARDALRTLEGTPGHPASVLGPEFRRRQELAMDFASGERSDYKSPDFIEAVDHALSVDTAIMRRMQSSRPGMGQIQDLQVTQVQPAEGGINVRVRVQAEGGSYDTWITKGRSTAPDAEPAVIPVDRIADNLTGMAFYRSAMEEDPDFRQRIVRLTYESNPRKFNDAMEQARRAYEAYLDARSPAPEGDPKPLSDFEQDALRTAFATDALPGSGGGDDGGDEVIDFGDLQ